MGCSLQPPLFLPGDASRRFQSRSGYLTRKHPNKQPVFPRMLSLVVYGVISNSTRAINFLTICHRFYEPLPPSTRSAQASLWGEPNQGQWLCGAMGITYPSMGSTRHLAASWKPWKTALFIQSMLFSPIRQSLGCPLSARRPRASGPQDGNLPDPTAPVASLDKYWWDHPSVSLLAPICKRWAMVWQHVPAW